MDDKTLETILKVSSSKEMGINFQLHDNCIFETDERNTNFYEGMMLNQQDSFTSDQFSSKSKPNDPFFDTTMRKSMSKKKVMDHMTNSRKLQIKIVDGNEQYSTLQPQNSGIRNFKRGPQKVDDFTRFTSMQQNDSSSGRLSRERFSIDLRETLTNQKISSKLNDNKKKFFKVACKFKGVCLARCSPSMKSLVTEILNDKMGKVVLSIGDGGNDVGMIQIANVGIGILGKEGNQAALAADFNIAQFRYILTNYTIL